jgi:Family of unknown function (DUF6267)
MKITELFQRPVNQLITEGIVHPEDAIWTDGVDGARRSVEALAAMGKGSQLTTIKWDGFPALVFGRNVDGQLMVTDKHMFEKKDGSGRVTSPDAFQQYDINRGADRADLYGKINILWPALESIIPGNFRGFYFGDLLYAGRLQDTNGYYVFRPNTVTYKVKTDSPEGQRIGSSMAGIAVHSFIPGIGEPDQPLKGLGGLPADGNPIWFVSGEMPAPKVKIGSTDTSAVTGMIDRYAEPVTKFLSDLTGLKAKGIIGLASKYITSKITAGNFDNMLEDFYVYLGQNLSGAASAKLLGTKEQPGYLYTEGQQGLAGMFAIWVALYNFKLKVKQQIDAQQASGNIQAYTGSDVGHEGYVVGGGTDKFKLIDRLGFSRANFAKNT